MSERKQSPALNISKRIVVNVSVACFNVGCLGVVGLTQYLTSLSCSSADGSQTTHQKGGTLVSQFPQKSEGKELKILVQPETQHRARYLTEGSRGSVKDRTQQSFPTLKVRLKPGPGCGL
jgi:hypothetical protein